MASSVFQGPDEKETKPSTAVPMDSDFMSDVSELQLLELPTNKHPERNDASGSGRRPEAYLRSCPKGNPSMFRFPFGSLIYVYRTIYAIRSDSMLKPVWSGPMSLWYSPIK